MTQREKITSLTVKVPYHGSGNVIREREVSFDIFKQDGSYSAVPDLDLSERRLANLPPELSFEYKEGRHISKRGNMDGNLHVIQNIVAALKERNLLT